MSHELKGREIFAVGTWNGMEFVEADIDDIVANFDKLKDTHKVPLKFGHGPDHEKDKNPMGQPAIGWISRVFKEGQKLFADFSDMPTVVFDAIKNKLYRTVSIEVLFGVDNDGNRFNHVLDAVALLGADQPAVSGLEDLNALLATRTSFTGGHRVAFDTIAGKGEQLQKDDEMDKKEVQELIDATTQPLKDANAELTKKLDKANETIAKFTSEKADDETAAAKEKVTLARKAVVAVLDAAVNKKALTPALRENYEKQIGVDDDERVVDIKLDDVRKMFSVTEKDENVQQGHEKKDDDKKDFDDDPGGQLMTLTRKHQADKGEDDFAVAFGRVCLANPELHVAYLNSNGEKP